MTTRHSDHLVRRVAFGVAGGMAGLIFAVIVVLNLHILAGLEEGYGASPQEVWDYSFVLVVADIALLAGGAVVGFLLPWRWTGRTA